MNLLKILLILYPFFLLNSSLAAKYKIDRIEPPNWWAGMVSPDLQLLVYGENIAELIPEINYEGVTVDRVNTGESPNYLFVDLKISSDAKPGTIKIDFRKNSKKGTSFDYQLLARKEGSAARQGFTNSDVLYVITPDRFVNGNPDNDNLDGMLELVDRKKPIGRHGGDIDGMLNSLDYISDLGFNAIWINPVLENNQAKESYHGYSITDFYKVDPRYGSNEEYLKLSELAQEKGIKLIMDMITNHCGSYHWWMKDLPSSDWINSDNKFSPTNHKKPTIQDPYVSDYDLKGFVDGWFVETMPDLNTRNPLLATYLTQNSIWWIEYANLAGIRMDTYPYNDKDFMTFWTCGVMNEYPDFNITGEEWNGNPLIVGYWQKGNSKGYESCLPSLIDFPLQESLKEGLIAKEGKGFNKTYEMLANDHFYADPENFVVFPDNHDMDRFYTQVNEDLDLFKLGIAYILTIRGIPHIYYGTELLYTNEEAGNHDQIRREYAGGWADHQVNAFTGKGLTDEQKEATAFIQKILKWRKEATAIHNGNLKHFAPDQEVYVFFRFNDNNKVMVVLSRNSNEVTLSLDRFSEIVMGANKATDIISGKEFELGSELIVPARTPMILELN